MIKKTAQAVLLSSLRQKLASKGVQAYVLPKTDEFMSAYIPKEKDKLYNLTNFTGSNGMVIVYADGVMNDEKKSQRNPLFITDSRYKLQASLELDNDLFDI